MPMTYSSLTAAKGSAGSIANWVGYGKLDVGTILDEAQSLIYGLLRVREMRETWTFGMAAGSCSIALPARFLDPIGELRDTTNSLALLQKSQEVVELRRMYEARSGSFGADPFTAVAGSNLVTTHLAGHGLTEGSSLRIAGASTVGALNLDDTFPVVEIVDPDTLVFSTGDNTASANATGGGSSATYTADRLIDGSPSMWGIFDEKLNFDTAFEAQTNFRIACFRAKPLLSSTNESNFLTNRYPKLIRIATTTAAAEMMKDDQEYQKGLQALTVLIETINAENDMFMRGGAFGTDTPTPGDYY